MKMKQTLAIMAALAVTGVALKCYAADGAVWLNNYDANNPIYYLNTSTKASAADTWVQIFGGTQSLATGGLSEDGFFDFQYGVITGADPANDVTIKVQAWKGAAGSTYANATQSAEASWTQKPGSVPPLPAAPNPTVLQFPNNFVIKDVNPNVPEPSTIALALLGGAALLLRRRN